MAKAEATRAQREQRQAQGVSGEALMAIRKDMLRFAELQLRDSHAAEDVVQESIESALGVWSPRWRFSRRKRRQWLTASRVDRNAAGSSSQPWRS